MSVQTAAPAAGTSRLQKPSWKDPRLLLGLLLVCASVAGVTALVEAADDTVEVYAAGTDLPAGSPVRAQDLRAVPVRLGDLQQNYLPVADGVPQDAVAGVLLREGELVSRASLGKAQALDRKPVGLTVTDPLPAGLGPGSRVDVWASAPDGRNGYLAPEQLLVAAEVFETEADAGVLGAGGETRLLVLVEDSRMARLLGAMANQARLTVVMNPAGN